MKVSRAGAEGWFQLRAVAGEAHHTRARLRRTPLRTVARDAFSRSLLSPIADSAPGPVLTGRHTVPLYTCKAEACSC